MSNGTSILYILEYIIGFFIFGIIYGILNGIVGDISVVAVEGSITNYANMFWTGSLIVYIIMGLFWLPRKIKEYGGGVLR